MFNKLIEKVAAGQMSVSDALSEAFNIGKALGYESGYYDAKDNLGYFNETEDNLGNLYA